MESSTEASDQNKQSRQPKQPQQQGKMDRSSTSLNKSQNIHSQHPHYHHQPSGVEMPSFHDDEDDSSVDDQSSVMTTDEYDSNQQILEMKSQRISFLEAELKKTSSYLIDIQTKLHQTQLLLEATEVANREGNENRAIAELDVRIRAVTEENGSLKDTINSLKIANQEHDLNAKQLLLQIHERDSRINHLTKISAEWEMEKQSIETRLENANRLLEAKFEEIKDFREKISELEMEKLQLRERYILRTNLFESAPVSLEEAPSGSGGGNVASGVATVNIDSIVKELEELKASYNSTSEINKRLVEESSKYRAEAEASASAARMLRESLSHHITVFEDLSKEISIKDEYLMQLKNESASLRAKIETLEKVAERNQDSTVELPSNDHEREKLQTRLISSLQAKVAYYENLEGNLNERIEKLKACSQHYQSLASFFSTQNRQIMTGESVLLSRIDSLTQKCVSLEEDVSKFRHNNEELLRKNNELASSIRDLQAQIQDKKRDCTIMARQLNVNIEDYFQKHRDDILKLFGGKNLGKTSKPSLKGEEDVCRQIEKIISSRGRSIPKDVSTINNLQNAMQTIRKLTQVVASQYDTIQKLQSDSKLIIQLQPRFYKLLQKVELERDSLLQTKEMIESDIKELRETRERQVKSALKDTQSQVTLLYDLLSETNEENYNLYSQLVDTKKSISIITQDLETKTRENQKIISDFEKKLKERDEQLMNTSSKLEASIQKYFDDVIRPILSNSTQPSQLSLVEQLLSEIHGQKQIEKLLMIEKKVIEDDLSIVRESYMRQKDVLDSVTHEMSLLRNTSTKGAFNFEFVENQLQKLQKRYDAILNSALKNTENLIPIPSHLPESDANSNEMEKILQQNCQLKASNDLLSEELKETQIKLEKYTKTKLEDEQDYEEQLIAYEGQNSILISKLATHKLQIDELTNRLKEKEVEIEHLHGVLSKKATSKKKKDLPSEDMSEQLKSLIKSSSITHAKLRQSLQNEIDLRDKLEQKSNQVLEMKKALEAVQKNPTGTVSARRSKPSSSIAASPVKSSSRSIVRLSGALTEREGEINALKKNINTLELEITQLREDLAAERMSHSNDVTDLDKQVRSLTEKLQAVLKQKLELEKRLENAVGHSKSQEAALDSEREKLILKLKELTAEHERLHAEFSAQNLDYVECKVLLGKRESEIVEKDNQMVVLKDHLAHLRDTLETYKEELKNKMFEFEKSQVINDGNLDKTLIHLQQEQSNVHRLMDLVQKLQHENDLLMKEKLNAQKLRDQLQLLHPKYEQLLKEKNSVDEQFSAAKDYILQLRQERDQIKQALKQEKEKFSTELKNFNLIQKQLEETLERKMEDMKENQKKCENEHREKEIALKNNFQVYIEELNCRLDDEKEEIMKERLIFQKNEHRYQKLTTELEEKLGKEQEKCRELEARLSEEKEQNMQQITQIDDDFRSYKDAQEKVIDVYEKELRELKENVRDTKELETQLRAIQQDLQEKEHANTDLLEKIADYESQVNDLKGKVKGLNKQLTKLQKELMQEKETLQEKVEEAKKGSDEILEATEELKNAKKQIKLLTDEHAKKSKLITSLKEERDELQEKILKYETEQQQFSEKSKAFSKDITRKEQLVKEYKQKLETKKQDLKSKEDQNNSLKLKIKELTNSDTRKDKLIKDLQNVVEQNNKYSNQLKAQIKQAEEEVEKKDNRYKALETKMERLQQTDDLKQKHLQEQVESCRQVLVTFAEDQVKEIERLEIKLNATIATSNQISSVLRKQISSSSSSNSIDSLISRSSDGTPPIPDTSSISMHMLNLSPDELEDIMSSTRILEESIATHNQRQEEILRRSDRTDAAKSALKQLRHCLSNNDMLKVRKLLEKILSMRIELEKSLSIANKESFFTSGSRSQLSVSLEQNPSATDSSDQAQNEAKQLKEEIKKMQEREHIYENTIQSLEHHLNQLLSPEA